MSEVGLKNNQEKFNSFLAHPLEVIYPCDPCDYKATVKSNLRIHVDSIHVEVIYPCDQLSSWGIPHEDEDFSWQVNIDAFTWKQFGLALRKMVEEEVKTSKDVKSFKNYWDGFYKY